MGLEEVMTKLRVQIENLKNMIFLGYSAKTAKELFQAVLLTTCATDTQEIRFN